MTGPAAPGGARVRVGPVLPGAPGSRAPQFPAPDSGPLSSTTLVAEWPWRGGGRAAGERAITGTLLAADDRWPARWLETADVIVATSPAGGGAPGQWLRRYPGCAVAAGWLPSGEYTIATRHGVLPGVAAGGHDAASGGALACAAFIHGWLAAGLPLRLFRPPRLRVSAGPAARPEPGRPLFFRFSYAFPPEPAPSEGGASASRSG